jgi:hypothetical protein
MLRFTSYLLLVLVSSYFPNPVAANEESKQIQELASQVAALKDEMAELKKMVESLRAAQPTVTMLMPNFAERLHVMHYAGEAGDWAVASHELLGLKHLVKVMQQVDPEKGAIANGFLGANFKQLDTAIEHENLGSFRKSLDNTVSNCNGCHVAVGSPAMKITLDVNDNLSIRHSHDLVKSKMPGEHMHN